MAVLFRDVLRASRRDDINYSDTTTRDWFRDKAQRSWFPMNPASVIRKRQAVPGLPPIGEMVMFHYDPKHKATLPYYDSYPLIFPIQYYNNGFLGLNMHYLPPLFRARLMDALYTRTNNKKFDETTKLRLSLQILTGASKFKYFQPTLHRYLTSHVRSNIVTIDSREWDYTLFLPLARFQKASQQHVWNESVQKITGGSA